MKIKILKAIALLLLLAMTAFVFAACESTGAGNGSESESLSETPTETEPLPAVENVEIVKDGKSSFTIVRAETAADYEKTCASAIRTALHDKCGAVVSITSDWINESAGMVENEYEILVGRVSRDESIELCLDMRVNDYSITVSGTKIVIAAFTEEKLTEAVNYFISSLEISEGSAIFPGDKVKEVKGSYSVEKVTVDGTLLSSYRIVHRLGASESEKAAANKIASAFRNNYGYELSINSDSTNAVECEIIVGGSNRGNSQAEADKLRAHDYKIYAEGKKIYVVMGSEAADAAADAFIALFDGLKADGKLEATTDKFSLDYKSDAYKTGVILLNGTPIEEYTIVYSRSETGASYMADTLKKAIEEMCGRKLSVLSDGRPAEGGKEIIVGFSSRIEEGSSEFKSVLRKLGSNEYLVCSDGNGNLYVGGRQYEAAPLTAAVNSLIKAMRTTGDSEKVVLDYTSIEATKIVGKTYSMMSYNDGDNSYKIVDDRCTIVSDYMPDILCFQETQEIHARVYKVRLEVYDYVYYDNDGTTYNSQPIYYKRDMFELVESGIQWLSDTPDVRSKYSESAYTRSYTYAILRDKETGVEIVIVNTHIDYTAAATAKQTARLIELTQKFRDRPIFYFGDFNMQRASEGYNNMIGAGLNDTGRGLGNTQSVIDFCFYDFSMALPSKYKIVNDHELSSVASDHPAIYSEVMVIE